MSHPVPDTSHAAYEEAKGELIQHHQQKILEALKEAETATYEELAVATGLDKHAVGRRLSELMADNKIYRTCFQRKTSTGRLAYAHAIIGSGIPAAEETPKKQPVKEKQPKPVPIPTDKNVIPVVAHTRTIKKQDTPSNVKLERLF